MDRSEWDEPLDADYSAAVPLEISDETAALADDLLREFAEAAALETALVVDRSGGLVAGISSEAEVSVDVISALVAGASGAMQALVSHLGESGALESIHLGGNRLIYLKETVNRFILVAVAEASRPAGLVRQTALSIEARLAEVLREVRSPEPLPPVSRGRSLRASASAKAAPAIFPVIAGGSRFAEESIEELPIPLDEAIGEEMDFATFELDESELEEDEAPEIEAEEEQEEEEPQDEAESEAEETAPNEILEPIDFGEPEIVIERSERPRAQDPLVVMMPVDSPFEAEEEDESEKSDESDESEFEELVEEEIEEAELPPSLPESVFEWESDEEDLEDESEAEEEAEPTPGPPPLPELVFEEEIEEDEEEVKAVFELDGFEEDEEEEEPEDVAEPESEPEPEDEAEDDPSDEVGDEIEEMISEEEEESEIQSSGPFYF